MESLSCARISSQGCYIVYNGYLRGHKKKRTFFPGSNCTAPRSDANGNDTFIKIRLAKTPHPTSCADHRQLFLMFKWTGRSP